MDSLLLDISFVSADKLNWKPVIGRHVLKADPWRAASQVEVALHHTQDTLVIHSKGKCMLSQVDTPFSKIESLKSDILRILGSLTEAELQERPSPSDWTPLGVLEHIVLVEEWTAGPSEEAIPVNARVMLKGRIFVALVSRIMRSGLRVPTDPRGEPSGDHDLESLVRRWDKSRDLLKSKLQNVRTETLQQPIAMHPLAGPLNAAAVLTLLEVHMIYHLRQLPKR